MNDTGDGLLVGDANLGWAAGCCRRGASHTREGKLCQDAYTLTSGAVAGSPYVAVALADGHGDDRHDLSHLGAALAVKAALDEVSSLCLHGWPLDGFAAFPRRVGLRWREAVQADARERFAAVAEQAAEDRNIFVRYGTTLLTAVIAEHKIFFSQLGDGKVLLIRPGGTVHCPLPNANGDNIGVVTYSLCSADALHLWQTGDIDRGEGGRVLLATDGLVNAFSDDDQLQRFARSLDERVNEYGPGRVAEALPNWLDHYSTRGSGDDITLALLCIHPSPIGKLE